MQNVAASVQAQLKNRFRKKLAGEHDFNLVVVISEKFNAMVNWTDRTTRYKDFFDIYKLAHGHTFDGERIACAVRATFGRQGTPISAEFPPSLGANFYSDTTHDAGWRKYVADDRLQDVPTNFSDTGETIRAFLIPPWEALAEGTPFTHNWDPNHHWVEKPTSREGAP